MRVVIQRVSEATVKVDDNIVGKIGKGLLILLGIEEKDKKEDIEWLTKKILNLRIFPDDQNIMNKSILDMEGTCLVISQFTLFASYKKGNRPSYMRSAKPIISQPLYEQFLKNLTTKMNQKVESGIFGADMQVSLINDGPVTIFMDTKNKE